MKLFCFFLFCVWSFLNVHITDAFLVRIVNITECQESDLEIGTMTSLVLNGRPFDQRLSATVTLPELTAPSHVKYESHAWDPIGEDFEFLFSGRRSLCNHLVNSIGYEKLRNYAYSLPAACPIPEGEYSFDDFPVSGQYAALSELRNVYPLVRHKIKMVVDDVPVLCRMVFTLAE